MSKEIDEALGLNPLPPMVYDKQNLAPVVADEEQIKVDVDEAREGLYSALDASQRIVMDLASIAQQSQSAKAYEVLNSAIKTLSDISMSLAELQLKKQRLEGKNKDEGPTTVNNNLIMSTDDVLKLLKNGKDD